MNSQITYEPVEDHFPAQITAEDLHNLIETLRPFLDGRERPVKIIQIENE